MTRRSPPLRRLRDVPYRWTYAVAGVLLALGAPLGLLLLRSLLAGLLPTPEWVHREIGQRPETYAYLAISTPVVFAVLGLLLGSKEDRLRALAMTDGLTGLANRRFLHARLTEELARAVRYGTPVSLLFIDLDGLKRLNDEHGHETGDEALRLVTHGIRRACRATDLAARIGGDEFAVVAPWTTVENAMSLAERIRGAVRLLAASAGGDFRNVSVSIGATDNVAAGRSRAECLYASADEALYRAKHAGGDRCAPATADAGIVRAFAATAPRKEQFDVQRESHTRAG